MGSEMKRREFLGSLAAVLGASGVAGAKAKQAKQEGGATSALAKGPCKNRMGESATDRCVLNVAMEARTGRREAENGQCTRHRIVVQPGSSVQPVLPQALRRRAS